MALVKGPWELEWGANPIVQVEEIEVDFTVDSEDYTTVQHQTYELDGSVKASVMLTLLATDITALAVVLPDYFVAMGGTMSSGETVEDEDGAIDYVATCDTPTNNDLDISSCADPAQVFRIKNARTKIDSISFDDKVRKVVVKFVGEAEPGDATIQFFPAGGLSAVS
jgi:hypothetical protein